MKLAFVTQRYMPEYTWETTRWSTPDEMLDAYALRSKNYGMIYELRADCYVIEDAHETGVHRMLKRLHPEGIAALYAKRKATPWRKVPWENYEVVITIDPCLTPELTARYPKILWCYYAGEHKAPDYKASCQAPYPGYDVFMDHVLRIKMPRPFRLPVSVPFPALASKRAFDDVLHYVKRDNGVFLDSRALRKEKNHRDALKRLSEQVGLPVRAPRPWNYAASYLEAARGNIESPRKYLERVKSCRYFVLMRGTKRGPSGLIGQAAIEAAACGCIVLSGHGRYPDRLCHLEGYIDPKNWNSVIERIKRLEADERLRAEVLAHQERKLKEQFWEYPMSILGELLERKRE